MQLRARTLIGSLGAVAFLGVMVPTASASQSATAGKNTCTVTAVAPTLSAKNLFGKATVTCSVSTTVTLEMGVVEMDGTLEDTKVPIAVKSVTVVASAGKAVSASTATATCLSTETDNEEYATKVRVNISGTVSAWDRTVPANNQYAC